MKKLPTAYIHTTRITNQHLLMWMLHLLNEKKQIMYSQISYTHMFHFKQAKNHFFSSFESILCKHWNHIYRAIFDPCYLYLANIFHLSNYTPRIHTQQIIFSYFQQFVWCCLALYAIEFFLSLSLCWSHIQHFRLGEFSLIGN